MCSTTTCMCQITPMCSVRSRLDESVQERRQFVFFFFPPVTKCSSYVRILVQNRQRQNSEETASDSTCILTAANGVHQTVPTGVAGAGRGPRSRRWSRDKPCLIKFHLASSHLYSNLEEQTNRKQIKLQTHCWMQDRSDSIVRFWGDVWLRLCFGMGLRKVLEFGFIDNLSRS